MEYILMDMGAERISDDLYVFPLTNGKMLEAERQRLRVQSGMRVLEVRRHLPRHRKSAADWLRKGTYGSLPRPWAASKACRPMGI